MEEIKEVLKLALQNKKAISESLKGSFHKLAIDKDANFLFMQTDKNDEIQTLYNDNKGGATIDTENKIQYIKAFLPNIEMILVLNDIKEEEQNEFYKMSEDILKNSFKNSKFHTIAYSRVHKHFFGTDSEEWEQIEISDFIDLENFINVVEKII